MGHHVARAVGATFDFQLDAVCGVHKTRGAAVHCLVCHGAQINQKPKLTISVELLQIHIVTVGKFQEIILTACKRTAISLISLHLIHKSSVPSLP